MIDYRRSQRRCLFLIAAFFHIVCAGRPGCEHRHFSRWSRSKAIGGASLDLRLSRAYARQHFNWKCTVTSNNADIPDTLRRVAPAAERNRGPILDVLSRVLPKAGVVLEIASGTGQHAVHFAAALPGITWQPSDPDAASRASIDAWRQHVLLDNLNAPIALDVRSAPWPVPDSLAAIVCINMIHIAPWEAAEALFQGAGEHLAGAGVLFLYGPYKRGGAHTAPSNEAFDDQLRATHPAWGIRNMEDVVELGRKANLWMEEAVPMPANNFCLIFRRTGI
jgi:SAM-dependent methyltransferase